MYTVWIHAVTTLRVVWIEIHVGKRNRILGWVTTLRVVWIEISISRREVQGVCCHHLAGGVD